MLKQRTLLALLLVLLCLPPLGAWAQECRRLTLDELFTLAEENSKTIAAERVAVSEAEAAVVEAKGGRLPDLDISASASFLGNGMLTDRDFSNAMSVEMPHFGNNFAVEASQLIYGGGAVSNAIALARLKEEMAGVNLDATRSRVRFLLTGFFLELGKMRNILEVYDRNIALAEELIADTEARCREGVALTNDLTRYELRLQRLELARTEVKNTIRILSFEIATTVGLDPATEIIPAIDLDHAPLEAHDEGSWQELAAASAYDLRRGELKVAMGERAEQLARAERRPTVALVAANHFDGPITIEVPVINKNFNYWYVGVGVSFKLSSLYKNNRTIRREQIATLHSRHELEDAREKLALAIHSDYIRYEEAFIAADTYRKGVELAESNYNVIEKRYNNDIALVTDMVDAANQLLDAELQLANARINILVRYAKLQHTSGLL